MMSPGATVCSAGPILHELVRPPLWLTSQLYPPARPPPMCAIHGQTRSGGALIVIAWVDVKIGSGTIPSVVSERRCSTAVAQQVASAIMSWPQHLSYLPHR